MMSSIVGRPGHRRNFVRWIAFPLAVVGAGAIFVFVASSFAPKAAGSDTADMRNTIQSAVQAQYDLQVISPGEEAGQLSSVAVRTLSKYFTGDALTQRLNTALVWVDQLKTTPGLIRVLNYKINQITIDEPVTEAGVATVTGTYTVTVKNAANRLDGQTVTWGGKAVFAYSAQLHRLAGQWLVSAFDAHVVDSVSDPSMDSGQTDPTGPLPTKHLPASFSAAAG